MNVNRAALLLIALAPLPLAAHHSFVAFDGEKEAFVRGTVTEFRLRNPHTYLFIAVPMENGETAMWRIEGETRNDLYRNGWRDDSLQPGDVVTVRVSPAKDPARRYGRLLSLEKADGTVLTIPLEEDTRGRANAVPAEELEGVWLPIQDRFFDFLAKLGSLANEKALAARAQQSGLPAAAQCIDLTIPLRLGRAHVYEIEFVSEDLVLIHSEDDAEPRRIHMDGRGHPASIPDDEKTWTGHSIGRWEGEALVIDTRHFRDHPEGHYAGPSGSQKHLVEQYTLNEDKTRIVLDFTLDDPEYLTSPVSYTFEWQHSPHITRLPHSCDPESALGYVTEDP